MNNRKGGWQCWVDIEENYVVKTPKKRREIEETVSKYLKHIGKIEELEMRVGKMISDVRDSQKIIKNTKAPKRLFGSPKFKTNGKIIQQKAVEFSEFLKGKSDKEIKNLLDRLLDLILELWKYGIHEKTFKFFTNYGIIEEDIILMDFLEITNKKETVEKQIMKGSWNKPDRFLKYLSKDLSDWFTIKASKIFSLKTLEKYWNDKLV